MRALIAQTFPAYTFEAIDGLVLDDVIELFAAAQWLMKTAGRQRGRRE